MKKKTIKAWAIRLKETGEIQTGEYFSENECPASYCPPTMAIFEKKSEAELERKNCLNPQAQEVILVEIKVISQ